MDTYETDDNAFPALSARNDSVSPAETPVPEGAWQEEESLEVYKKKRTQRPPDGQNEIVRFVRRQPRSGEEVYETVRPRHDGRRELILLEPVRFSDEPPEAVYDDYSLYRMEEYVDVGSELCECAKEPAYYTIQKVEKGSQPTSDIGKFAKEEVIAPAKEMETMSLKIDERETVEKRSSHEEIMTHPPTTPLRERGPYVCTVPVVDVPMERVSDAERSEMSCSRCSELFGERSKETPVLDRRVFYEREIARDDKSAEREARERRDSHASSRQTFIVGDAIAQANKRVDSVFRGAHDSFASRGNLAPPIRTLTTVREEDFSEENLGSLKKSSSEHLVNEYKETYKDFSKNEKTATPIIHVSPRPSSTGHRPGMQMYGTTIPTLLSRSASTAPSIRSAARTPYCSHCQMSCRKSDRSYTREPSVIREVPVQKEWASSTSKKSRTNEKTGADIRCSAPVHETITTERFERIEKVRKAFPTTPV